MLWLLEVSKFVNSKAFIEPSEDEFHNDFVGPESIHNEFFFFSEKDERANVAFLFILSQEFISELSVDFNSSSQYYINTLSNTMSNTGQFSRQ